MVEISSSSSLHNYKVDMMMIFSFKISFFTIHCTKSGPVCPISWPWSWKRDKESDCSCTKTTIPAIIKEHGVTESRSTNQSWNAEKRNVPQSCRRHPPYLHPSKLQTPPSVWCVNPKLQTPSSVSSVNQSCMTPSSVSASIKVADAILRICVNQSCRRHPPYLRQSKLQTPSSVSASGIKVADAILLGRDRDQDRDLSSRDRDETETFAKLSETRPRRDPRVSETRPRRDLFLVETISRHMAYKCMVYALHTVSQKKNPLD